MYISFQTKKRHAHFVQYLFCFLSGLENFPHANAKGRIKDDYRFQLGKCLIDQGLFAIASFLEVR